MRIMLMTLYYYPDNGGTPSVYKDLCESLVSLGHDVVVVTGLPRYNITQIDKRYKRRLLLTEKINGVEVKRIKTLNLPRYFPAARAMDYFLTAALLFFRSFFTKRADIALVHSPTLFEAVAALILRRIKGTPFVLNVHDIFPQTAIDLGLLRNKTIITFFQRLESFVYQKADCITVHSPGNREWIKSHTAGLEKIVVMPIWMNVKALKPGSNDNEWRRNHGLSDKFIILFSGSQGYNQDIKVILEAAERLRNHQQIRFVIIGNGVQHNNMVELSRQMNLANLDWLDWQSDKLYPMVLQAADIILSTLNKNVKTPVVSSKILSAMSTGRPVITCTPLWGDAPKLVRNAKAGITIDAGNACDLAKAILIIYKNRFYGKWLGDNGRRYVEQFLNVDRWAAAHIDLFSALTTPDKDLTGILSRIACLMEQESRIPREKRLTDRLRSILGDDKKTKGSAESTYAEA